MADYVFLGTPEFAATILEKLVEAGLSPALVVCNPDRPAGRKKIITPPATKNLAQKYGLNVWQPEELEVENWKLKIGEASFAVVAAYAKIIPEEIIRLFSLGVLGVHPSLLPKYRGSSPIQQAILDGAGETGVTIYLLDEKVDHGPILAQRELEFPISNFQLPNLLEKLAELGGNLLVETLPKYLNHEIKSRPQDESKATYTKKFSAEDAFVKPEDLEKAEKIGGEIALQIERKIRALNPGPGVWTLQREKIQDLRSKRIKLLGAEIKNGKLKLKKIQREGGKPYSP